MSRRLPLVIAAMSVLLAAPVSVQLAPATPPPADTDGALVFATLDTRMTVPVSIGAAGPWRFVIDTGAERSVVARRLGEELALPPGRPLRVVAMAGTRTVPSLRIADLRVGALPPAEVEVPALDGDAVGAAGMLGLDVLRGRRVAIDFDASTMAVEPSPRRRIERGRHGDEVVVTARSRFGQLVVTDAVWRGRRIAVVLDTGTSMTIGNPALLALARRHAAALGPATGRSVLGVTFGAEMMALDGVAIGGIGLDHLAVAFADAAPFHRFGLVKRPALMLGMDALRLFRHVRIDFANRAVEFALPASVPARR